MPDTPTPPGFDAVYRAHRRRLTQQLWAYTGDLPLAQDLVQEAFCRAYARWGVISTYGDPAGWVRRVAWNLAASRWRRARIARDYLGRQRAQHVAGPSPERVLLTTALAALPDRHRRALVMHHLDDMSVADIALREHVSEGTVKSWLYRGRARLAELLETAA
ncbi:MAG TPA: SigE family RNA polymerase sigma factor [Asanoa sp.]